MSTVLPNSIGPLPLAASGTNWELVMLVAIGAAVILTIAWLAFR